MKLLVDMNLSPRWMDALVAEGFEAVHWSAVGLATAPDVEIMGYARLHGFVVLTHDLDFSAILAATGGEGPSVIQIRAEDISPEALSGAVVRSLRQMAAELESGVLLTIDSKRTRLRILPLLRRD